MNISLITKELQIKHSQFINYIDNLTQKEYQNSYNKKWDAGQHLDHITKSVAILSKAFSYPKWLLRYKFGKANRVSRTKDELVLRYTEKLINAKSTPSLFQGKFLDFNNKKQNFKKLQLEVKLLIKKTKKYSEKDLDKYILPHPLLGKLTCREMLLFTILHVAHHEKLIAKYLKL